MHPLLRYVLIATPLSALVFYALAGGFASWDGRVTSFRPSAVEDPAVLTVLVVDDAGDGTEVDWPADLVGSLKLKADPTGTPPNDIPENAPYTQKLPFTLFYTLKAGDDDAVSHPIRLAQPISVAVLVWVVGFLLFNMWRSGSPFSWEDRNSELPPPMPSGQGQAAPAPPAARSKKGPPPPRRRTGGGRRRK